MPSRTSAYPKTVVLVGNPRPLSRTRVAAEAVAEALDPDGSGALRVIELADLLPDLASGPGAATQTALTAVAHADLLVVATPVYKASFTGLLKLFLDRLPSGALQGTTAVVVTVAAADSHRPLADLHLRPVLLELGATLPTSSVTLTEAQLPHVAEVVDTWAHAGARTVRATVQAHRVAAEAAA